MSLSEKRKQAITYEVIEGYVMCDGTGGVHDDSLDPYNYGDRDLWCKSEDHSPIYRAAEGKVK